jgi:hypothetical protein
VHDERNNRKDQQKVNQESGGVKEYEPANPHHEQNQRNAKKRTESHALSFFPEIAALRIAEAGYANSPPPQR